MTDLKQKDENGTCELYAIMQNREVIDKYIEARDAGVSDYDMIRALEEMTARAEGRLVIGTETANDDLLHIRLHGRYQRPDFEKVVPIVAEHVSKGFCKVIVDFRDVSPLELKYDDIFKRYSRLKELREKLDIKIAVLYKRNARIFRNVRKISNHSGFKTDIFKSKKAAIKWLNSEQSYQLPRSSPS
jgi:hypothetical protein